MRKQKKQNKKALIIGGFTLFLIAIGFLSLPRFGTDSFFGKREVTEGQEAAAVKSLSPNENKKTPERLIIDKLGINAEVEHVGVDWKGNMAVPKGPKNVAWYKFGPSPGETGNAVIAGHLITSLGKGIFQNLDKLVVGDTILVQDEGGLKHEFKVVKIASYDIRNAPIQEIFGSTTKTALNLITCDGRWLKTEKTYSNRLVVFTERVNQGKETMVKK